jgi:hypothetical protein
MKRKANLTNPEHQEDQKVKLEVIEVKEEMRDEPPS